MKLLLMCVRAVLVVWLAAIGTRYGSAQILYGSLVGNVKDATEAGVAGAAVTVTNTQTNQSRQTVTNEAGAYSMPTLEPGTYQIRVSKAGFSTFSESNVVVAINSVSRVDVALSLGAVTQTVDVSAQSSVLQTDRSEVRAEINTASLENLPVAVGRNYQQLFRMIPGFRPPSN